MVGSAPDGGNTSFFGFVVDTSNPPFPGEPAGWMIEQAGPEQRVNLHRRSNNLARNVVEW